MGWWWALCWVNCKKKHVELITLNVFNRKTPLDFLAKILVLLDRRIKGLSFDVDLDKQDKIDDLCDFLNRFLKSLSFKEFIDFFGEIYPPPKFIDIGEKETKTRLFLVFFSTLLNRKVLGIKPEVVERLLIEKYDLHGAIKDYLERDNLKIEQIRI